MTTSILVGKVDDPDAQQTVNDFADYTEFLPSELERSLGLINNLDVKYLKKAAKLHDLTVQYGCVPQLPKRRRPDVKSLRREISLNLKSVLSARENAYAEAIRLYEIVDRHYRRLETTNAKLKALPKPPSRDPTPPPLPSRKSTPRLTLRFDGTKSGGRHHKPSERKKRITVPGEVLPPPNPDSPTSFTASDWESLPPSPLPMPTSKVGASSRKGKPVRFKKPKARPKARPKHSRIQKERPPRPPRRPGMGTNVHSQIAGISTSNALSLLPAPPPDPKPGSEHAPWMRLTEYEMAKLRKRMKKNAIWSPSETMIRRELADAGRGPDNYRSTKADAEAKGKAFLDVDNIATSAPGKPLMPGEISADSLDLSNRGMKLNEAKKLKREAMLAASAEELKATSHRVAALDFNQIFSNPQISPHLVSSATMTPKEKLRKKSHKKKKDKEREESTTLSQKRKREDETESIAPATNTVLSTERDAKRTRSSRHAPLTPTTVITRTTTTTVPLAPPAPSPRKLVTSKPIELSTPVMAAPQRPKTSALPKSSPVTATSSRPRRISLTLRGPPEPASIIPQSPRTSSRATSARGTNVPTSAGPTSTTFPRESLRRKSTTPATPVSPAKPTTAASHRSKRPAPGALIKNKDGGAVVSIGRRRHAPRGSMSNLKETQAGNSQEVAASEQVDPDEPRYCICGNVSYGEMVGCDNNDCEREWFHFACVGLTEHPPRRVKWYCPDCQKLGFVSNW